MRIDAKLNLVRAVHAIDSWAGQPHSDVPEMLTAFSDLRLILLSKCRHYRDLICWGSNSTIQMASVLPQQPWKSRCHCRNKNFSMKLWIRALFRCKCKLKSSARFRCRFRSNWNWNALVQINFLTVWFSLKSSCLKIELRVKSQDRFWPVEIWLNRLHAAFRRQNLEKPGCWGSWWRQENPKKGTRH